MNWLKFLAFHTLLITPSFVCASQQSLSFLNEQILPKKIANSPVEVGGLSAIAFDKKTNSFFTLSDDKKNHRFYKFKLTKQNKQNKQNFYKFKIQNYTLLKNPHNSMDPEGLSLYKDSLFVSSEGRQQPLFRFEPPQIFQFSIKGLYQSSWKTPSIFWNLKKIKSIGAQENKGFESLTLDSKKGVLWTATEEPLRQDLKVSNKKIRLSGFNVKTGNLILQLPYYLDNSEAGLVEMIWLKEKIFLTLERSYNKYKKAHFVQLFFTNCNQLTKKNACSKKQLLDFKRDIRSVKIDNVEGMTLGPHLSSGKRLLVFVSDNNFRSSQKNQVLFFSIDIPSLLKKKPSYLRILTKFFFGK